MKLLSLFSQPFMTLHLPPPHSFASQTVIITGANTGLGLETARHIVSLGASKVILGVRTLSKGLAAKADIEATTGRLDVVEVWEVDLESFASVKAFTSRANRLRRLDTAIMNAGLATAIWKFSLEGWERSLQVNALSTALMSLLLFPVLARIRYSHPGSTPHLVLVSSDMQEDAKLKERNAENVLKLLNDKTHWENSNAGPIERYAVSKLFDVYITLELARLTPIVDGEPAVIVDTVAPGFCKSELMTREPGAPFLLKVLEIMTARTIQEGSKTIVDAASRGNEAHGKYLDHQKIATPGVLIVSEEGVHLRQKIWKEILEVLKPVSPEIINII